MLIDEWTELSVRLETDVVEGTNDCGVSTGGLIKLTL
jgi:hypothetical protein